MEEGNLAATYSALAALVALGADLAADVDGDTLVQALGSLQQEDGRWGEFLQEIIGGGSFLALRQACILLSCPSKYLVAALG